MFVGLHLPEAGTGSRERSHRSGRRLRTGAGRDDGRKNNGSFETMVFPIKYTMVEGKIHCKPLFLPLNTSSTAQGGGGSFKNRKPIGEVGCCESRMAERSH